MPPCPLTSGRQNAPVLSQFSRTRVLILSTPTSDTLNHISEIPLTLWCMAGSHAYAPTQYLTMLRREDYDVSVIPVGGTVQPELPDTLPFHIDAEAEGSDKDSDTEDATEGEDDNEDATFSTEDLDSNMTTVEQLYNLNMWLHLRTNEQPEEDDGITAVPGTASFVPVAFDNYLLMARMRHNGSRRTQTLKLQSEYHEP